MCCGCFAYLSRLSLQSESPAAQLLNVILGKLQVNATITCRSLCILTGDLRIPPSVVPDYQIQSFCAIMDTDFSGAVDIEARMEGQEGSFENEYSLFEGAIVSTVQL